VTTPAEPVFGAGRLQMCRSCESQRNDVLYLNEYVAALCEYPLFHTVATVFYGLVVLGLIQASKWNWMAVTFALALSSGLGLACLTTMPNEALGDGGGVAMPMHAIDYFIASFGGVVGSTVGLGVLLVRNST